MKIQEATFQLTPDPEVLSHLFEISAKQMFSKECALAF